jgi:hypothetical protein
MFGLMTALRQRIRYRRRWGRLAAAATAAADSATADLIRREDDRRSRQESRPRHPAPTRRTDSA